MSNFTVATVGNGANYLECEKLRKMQHFLHLQDISVKRNNLRNSVWACAGLFSYYLPTTQYITQSLFDFIKHAVAHFVPSLHPFC